MSSPASAQSARTRRSEAKYASTSAPVTGCPAFCAPAHASARDQASVMSVGRAA